jgi:ribonuclease G
VSAELLLSVSPGEVRAALLEDDETVELVVERPDASDGPGAVYLGRVTAVAEHLDAAFVDIGRGEAAFLPASAAVLAPGKQPIAALVHEGEAVLVQVTRGATGDKGPKATRRVALPGHRLVLRPFEPGVAAGRRLADAAERARLTDIVEGLAKKDDGFILRTAAEGADAAALEAEAAMLRAQWREIAEAARTRQPPLLLHGEADPVARILRDHLPGAAARVVTEGRAGFAAALAWCKRHRPELIDHVEAGGGALFEEQGVEAAIDGALMAEVPLPSGGMIAIEPTRALTAIDVDTGADTRPGGQARGILATNLEAAAAVARQLRLRNVGGLVAVDFVHMRDAAHRRQVAATLRKATADDPAAVDIGEITRFGLLELTRRRERPSLAELMLDPPYALGRRNALTVALAALRAVLRAAERGGPGAPVLKAAPEVIAALGGPAAAALAETETALARPLALEAEPGLARERIEIVRR